MSDYHVLEISPKGDTARVAFHLPIPDENNAAGKNLRTAYKEFKERDGVILGSEVPWLAASFPAEQTQIQIGEVAEVVETVQFNANATNANKQGEIDGRWTTLSTSLPAHLRRILRFWGIDRTVP